MRHPLVVSELLTMVSIKSCYSYGCTSCKAVTEKAAAAAELPSLLEVILVDQKLSSARARKKSSEGSDQTNGSEVPEDLISIFDQGYNDGNGHYDVDVDGDNDNDKGYSDDNDDDNFLTLYCGLCLTSVDDSPTRGKKQALENFL